MQVTKCTRRAIVVAFVCLLVAGSGVGTGAQTDTNSVSGDSKTATADTAANGLHVEFVNCSAVRVNGSADRVAVGTTWYAPDGVATSYFEYGPVNDTTLVTPPNQGETGTAVAYVTVYDDERATPVLTRQHPATTSCEDHIDPDDASTDQTNTSD
ncbi:hypothetical protein SAMN05421858_0453 [Haladaptatus litoreus]|uniref:Uncharacterized protein n=1 Tax=Haladaptatus litoreus TaxID=553468 RepID=A0A1N6VR78_9EURY|nr:hypothetical protein [Haladaptatus litoreus]SIQ80363.1 hypothetical protein SAMN05421858_0453 [Haladaptatus litoreus]